MEFFYSTFQQEMESVERLMGKDADPSRPYDFKYQAREILEGLLSQSALQDSSAQSIAANSIVEYMLGVNHFETEEITESDKHFHKSLAWMSQLPPSEQGRYINIIQDLLNSLGILCCNRGDNNLGLEYFQHSKAIYESLQAHPQSNFSHSFKDFMLDRTDFHFIIDGGVSYRKTEQNYTMCLFYMAQAYTKTEDSGKAAVYCAETMRRQVESGDFEIKDWAVNCINMAEYYQENKQLNAALYVLQSGLNVVKTTNKRKLKSTLHMQIGRCYRAFLEYGMNLHLNQEEVPACVYNEAIFFRNLNVAFPSIKPPLDIESAKEMFKTANSNLKIALDYFALDGYVTEHIEMKRDISALYKVLCYFEPSNPRVLAMSQRRVELLEEFTKELNKQAYSTLWQQLMNELGMIYIDLFDIKMNTITKKNKNKPETYNQANYFALTSIEKQIELMEFIEKIELNDDTAKDIIQSTLNLMFGIAKTYSKMESINIETKVNYIKHSLEWYEKIHVYLKNLRNGKYMSAVPDYDDQLRISEEMVALLPIRISQVNAERGEF